MLCYMCSNAMAMVRGGLEAHPPPLTIHRSFFHLPNRLASACCMMFHGTEIQGRLCHAEGAFRVHLR